MKNLTNFEIGHKAHQQKLHNTYKNLAKKLLLKKITVDQFVKKITNVHLGLEDLADRDNLIPHFYNFRGFQKTLPQALETVFRLKTSGTLLIMDVDQLKRFNDTFGHLGGSKLLKIYAQEIENSTRNTDLKARLGADEFAVFLIGTNIDNALFVAERIRTTVSDAIKKHYPNISWKQTISIGLSQAQENLSTEMLIQSADLALYQAKQNRDKAVIFSS